jgi:arsenite methyltransferase
MVSVNQKKLQEKVKEIYRKVADEPYENFHFELGRNLAEKLGYSKVDLERIPNNSVESFAGVGFHFDLAKIQVAEKVIDLGCGSGMDTFVAALKVGKSGVVVGVDMTREQKEKADRLRTGTDFENITFYKDYIETLEFENNSFDVVISNGVINLCAHKEKVFQEITRVLRVGGRMAISDIVTEKKLPEGVSCDADIWASCIGGAMQEDEYKKIINKAGLQVVMVRENPQYQFLSSSAVKAGKEFGIKSLSLLAIKD